MTEATLTKDAVIEALRTVYDPEIPVNLVDLGLIYGVVVDQDAYLMQVTTGLVANAIIDLLD